MIIATYISNGFVCRILSKALGYPIQKLIQVDKTCCTSLILAAIGGYPVGAKSVISEYKSGHINKEQAKKLALIAFSSGPGFVVNYVGNALLHSKKASYILLASQIISYLITAIIVGHMIKSDDTHADTKPNTQKTTMVEAVSSACQSMIDMCAMVITFSALISVLEKVFSKHQIITDILTSVLEITYALSKLCGKYPLYIISFLISFGGICVHFQVFSILKDIDINKKLFFLLRIIQGIIASCSTYILLILFPISENVFSSTHDTLPDLSSSIWGSLALILTAVCFISSLNKTEYKRR
ncbi:MAG: hypothetical protein IKB73_04785 [Ruminococcus sp.]|nr:hypothetical protein [Ruminococcus sp.]